MSRNPRIEVLSLEETIAAAARIAADPRRQATQASTQVILSMAVLLGQFNELAQLAADAIDQDAAEALVRSPTPNVAQTLAERLQELGYVPTQLQKEPPHGEV